MSHLRIPAPAPAENTTCGSLLFELQKIWDEIGESDNERDKMLLQLEQECLDVYRRKVDHASKYKAELHQLLADAEAEAANLVAALGERALNAWSEKPKGTLKEQISIIKPVLEDLRQRREERVKEFSDVQSHIVRICAEIAGNTQLSNTTDSQVDERDLTVKKLGELKSHLQELLKEKNLRLQKVDGQLNSIHELSTVMLIDFYEIMSEIHPSLVDSTKSKSISNDTLARLAGKVHSLKQEKQQRLQKIQELGSTLVELWNLMDMPLEEQKRFDRVTCLISASIDEVSGQGYLALDVIEQTEIEVGRLNILKASKMKELILKKQNELEEIYKAVHIDVDSDTARQILLSLIDSGNVDLSELLGGMDDQITKAKKQALSRKEILDKVEKWRFACEEESWLDDYEMDQNRYSAGRGVHKNLKRAEKARILVNKIPSLVENLRGKVRAWEEEKRMPFLYDKVPLLETLEEYTVLRQEREEEKRRSREQKRLQEQLATEQETLFGSKPSPLRLLSMKKQPIQGANAATPTGRRVSTPTPRHGVLAGKERKDGGRTAMVIPVNYVALPKDDSLSRNNSELVSP
ncbi:65-microtubule-associated protein 5-like protein [Cinnamomum micranthum f. kanehirae]|uniref:65-microtubule-associated protein 5-like protein n=1 Tax=Cinnamomum micranthum f. kanehirae TaxID=337451 RepID=A0A3S3M0A2_9MAGN|nr:65-microtubule-associated protein 5-like protein [Cinnamomum micranthum f. kanehirae]